jgi:hypothetical protein
MNKSITANKDVNYVAHVAVSATIGGTASVLGGGKFANGSITGAFQYMFNDAMKSATTNRSLPKEKMYVSAYMGNDPAYPGYTVTNDEELTDGVWDINHELNGLTANMVKYVEITDYIGADSLRNQLIADASNEDKLIVASHGNSIYGADATVFDDGAGGLVNQKQFVNSLPPAVGSKVSFEHCDSAAVTTNFIKAINHVRADYNLPPKTQNDYPPK